MRIECEDGYHDAPRGRGLPVCRRAVRGRAVPAREEQSADAGRREPPLSNAVDAIQQPLEEEIQRADELLRKERADLVSHPPLSTNVCTACEKTLSSPPAFPVEEAILCVLFLVTMPGVCIPAKKTTNLVQLPFFSWCLTERILQL